MVCAVDATTDVRPPAKDVLSADAMDAWQSLPLQERLRDCFAEIETVAEEVVTMLVDAPDAVAFTDLTDVAAAVQRIAGSLRLALESDDGTEETP